MYRLLISQQLDKEISKLGKVDQARVYQAISKLKNNPRPQGKKIKPFFGVEHGYRLRVGKVRVLYVVNDGIKEVKIVDIGYRGSIY